MATSAAIINFFLYRNDVLIKSGQLNGSKSFSYPTDDLSPGKYTARFSVNGATAGTKATITERSILILGTKR